ncbi:hypothetical protein ACFV9Z_13410 [Streptomyces sp. NPDC059883]|uniref:hypothetical protein n=1 Tax=unclassified Streptomyces TaxID=2593676 RepID=UPI00365184EF
MELPEIAIVVSSASAAITGVNAFVSYRTFRRVRPKIQVRLWRTNVSVPEQEKKDATHVFVLRLINNGTTPVTLERVELCRYESGYNKRRFQMVKGSRGFDPNNRWGTVAPVIPALDGTIYRFSVARNSITRGDHLRFRVLLSNGRTSTSRLLPTKDWSLDASGSATGDGETAED